MRTGYGKEPALMFFLRFLTSTVPNDFFIIPKHRDRFSGANFGRFRWSVCQVEDAEVSDDVFCAVVPHTHSFVLEDNILTGNCFTCGSGSLATNNTNHLNPTSNQANP